MNSKAIKGKKNVRTIAAVFIFISVVAVFYYPVETFIYQTIKLIVLTTLCYYMYRGKKWARNVIGVITGLLTLLSFFSGNPNSENPINSIILMMYFFTYGSMTLFLFGSSSVNEYFNQMNG